MKQWIPSEENAEDSDVARINNTVFDLRIVGLKLYATNVVKNTLTENLQNENLKAYPKTNGMFGVF